MEAPIGADALPAAALRDVPDVELKALSDAELKALSFAELLAYQAEIVEELARRFGEQQPTTTAQGVQ